MINVLRVNPPGEDHKFGRGVTISNQDIFEALAKQNISVGNLNVTVDGLKPGENHFIGQMLGIPLYVSHYGRFELDGAITEEAEVVDEGCKHTGWVVSDIQGSNRFLCRECNERFPRHPLMMKRSEIFSKALGAMKEFRQGMTTFTESIAAAGMSATRFKEALIEAFPPITSKETIQHSSVRDGLGPPITISETPLRTTDPEDLEETVFPTENCTNMDLASIWVDAFPDVTDVDICDNSRDMVREITFTFADGTMQLVKISHKDLDAARLTNQMNFLATGTPNPHFSKFTRPIARQCYPNSLFNDPKRID